MADIQQRSEGGASPVKQVRDYLMKPELKASLASACSKHVTPERLIRVACTALSRNPKLASCTKESLFLSLMTCGQLGLEPLLGRAHLIPRKNGKTGQLECQFQAGYQGLAELARRSGQISDLYAEVVYEKDQFTRTLGDNPSIVHVPYDGEEDPGALRFTYAVCLFKDGTRHRVCLNRREVYKRRDVSTAYQNWKKYGGDCPWIGPWESEMWKKTAVIALHKLLPLTIEMADAVAADPDAVGDVADLSGLADGAIDVTGVALPTEDASDGTAAPKPETKTGALAERIASQPSSPAAGQEQERAPATTGPSAAEQQDRQRQQAAMERRRITTQAMQAAAEKGGWTLDDLTAYYRGKGQLGEGKDWQALPSNVKAQIHDNPKLYAVAILSVRKQDPTPIQATNGDSKTTPNPETDEVTERETPAGEGDGNPFDAQPQEQDTAPEPRRIPATAIIAWCAKHNVPPTLLTKYARSQGVIPQDKDYTFLPDAIKGQILDSPAEWAAAVKAMSVV